jgi:putative transposase
MAAWLTTQGFPVNRKRVQRLMGLVAIYQRPNTSKAAPEHAKYPYLLGGLTIDRVNQVWCSGPRVAVHYLHPARQGLHLPGRHHGLALAGGAGLANFEHAARRLLRRCLGRMIVEAPRSSCGGSASRRSSIASDSAPPVRALARAQGSQFTSTDFTGVLKAHAIKISMDGNGRCMDNIFVERLWRSLKYEDIYLNEPATRESRKAVATVC